MLYEVITGSSRSASKSVQRSIHSMSIRILFADASIASASRMKRASGAGTRTRAPRAAPISCASASADAGRSSGGFARSYNFV